MVTNYLRTAFLTLLWVLSPLLEAVEPVVLYLTWVKDPTTTMVVQWQTPMGSTLPQLEYQARGDLTWKPAWKTARGQTQTVQDYDVHRVYLEELMEDSVYLFKVQDSKREYSFQTLPKKLTRPVKMVIGGDAYHPGSSDGSSELFHRMNRMIAFNKPDFVVIGGALAYTVGTKNLLKGPKGSGWALARWQAFLRDLQRDIGQDGRLIPMLPLVGNHDVNKPKNQTGKPELFYEIFTFPEMGKAYRCLDFGDYLSL